MIYRDFQGYFDRMKDHAERKGAVQFRCLIITVIIFVLPASAYSRENIIIGALAVGYDYQDRAYDLDEIPREDTDAFTTVDREPIAATRQNVDEGDERNFRISPKIIFSSKSLVDGLELSYAPSLVYDDLLNETDVDHELNVRIDKKVTREWNLSLDERLYVGDDTVRENEFRTNGITPDETEARRGERETTIVTGGPAAQGELTERFGRKRFWRNNLSVLSEYSYAQSSRVGVGYLYDGLRNINDNASDSYTPYDKHDGMLRIDHRFSPRWEATGEAHYVKGIFDDEPDVIVFSSEKSQDILDVEDNVFEQDNKPLSDDLEEYRFLATLQYHHGLKETYGLAYYFLSTDYDDQRRQDFFINQFALSWDYDLSQHVHINLRGGPSFLKRDSFSLETGYNAHIGISWKFFHGDILFYLNKQYDQDNFNGEIDGLVDVWSGGAEFRYQFYKNFVVNLFATYDDSKHYQFPTRNGNIPTQQDLNDSALTREDGMLPEDNNQPLDIRYDETLYTVGAQLSYGFWRWYTLNLGYRFSRNDSDLNRDDYDEHRVFVTLSAEMDLMRW